jgi:adenylate cyclase
MSLFRPRKTQPRTPRPALRGKPRHWSYGLAVAAPILVIGLLGVAKPPFMPDLSNLLFDWYQRLDPRAWDPDAPVRIVDIDDESLARLGQWPWPRSRIAEIVTRLRALEVAAVAVDIVFAEPDGASPENVLGLLPATPGRALLAQEIGARKSNDALLAEAIAAAPTVLGAILTQGSGAVDYPAKHGVVSAGDDPRSFLPQFSGAVVPLSVLSASAAGLGALNWLPDRDQVVRRVPLLLALREQTVASVAVETLRVAQGASTIIVRSSNASGHSAFGARIGVNALRIGDLEIPTDPRGEIRVRYSRSEPRRFIPAWKLLAGDVDRADVQNRIVLLGTSAGGLGDRRATPIEASIAGTEIQAQVIEQLLAGSLLVRPDWLPGAELALAILLSLALGIAVPRIATLTGSLGAAVTIGVMGWASWTAFSTRGLLVDPIIPSLSVALTYLSCVVWLYRDEQRQRRYVREAFGRYVSPVVVARLAEDPSKLVLGGETRTLTVMFCDIRGFTSIAERLDAQRLTRLMNEYLTPMTDVVLAHDGTIDKYVGDAVMAFWNAPLDDPAHADHAARAALAMTRELAALNAQWQTTRADGRSDAHDHVKFGIGLATGDCSVGNFGSARRFDYSVLGDQVNLASRLEGATKFYQTDILASEATRDLSPDLAWLEVDHVRVKGKTEVARIFTLVGDDVTRQSLAFTMLAELHAQMLAAYRGGDLEAAAAIAAKARAAAPPRQHDFYVGFERRCGLVAQSRPDDWAPITLLAEK